MSKKQIIILFLSLIFLGFLMILPFNHFCRLTNKCTPIILEYYVPKFASKEQYQMFFLAKNRMPALIFEAEVRSKIMNAGADGSIVYNVKNTSDHDISIRPMPYTIPEEASQYIKFYECLCFKEHKIKAGENIKMVVRFYLKKEIIKDLLFKESRIIVMGYEIVSIQ